MQPLPNETQPAPVLSPAPKRLNRRTLALLIVSLVVLVAVLAGFIWHATSSPAAPAGTWTKTHIYSGNGVYKTDTITLSNDWRIVWACNTVELPGDDYPLQISVYTPDGSQAGIALSTVCGGNNTSGVVESHQGGTVYLLITTQVIWSFSIQEVQ